MAVVSITAANVFPQSPSIGISTGICGESVAQGDVLYLKPADSLWWKADNSTLEKAGGIDSSSLKWCLSAGVAGQPVSLLAPGNFITLGAVLTKGIPYILSGTGGKIDLVSTLASGNFLVVMGYAASSSSFFFNPMKTGIQV